MNENSEELCLVDSKGKYLIIFTVIFIISPTIILHPALRETIS